MSSSESFQDWYREQYGPLAATLGVVAGDAHLGQDAAAEALARAYERWDRVSGMKSPGGWLYQVGLNVVRRRKRRLALERRLLRQVVQPAAVAPDSAEAVELWDAVSRLSPRQRTAIALRYLADLPERRVAELMNVAPGTTSATLVAGRKRLAELLSASTEVLS